MKSFILFGLDYLYPKGGTDDIVTVFHELEEVKFEEIPIHFDVYQILDVATQRKGILYLRDELKKVEGRLSIENTEHLKRVLLQNWVEQFILDDLSQAEMKLVKLELEEEQWNLNLEDEVVLVYDNFVSGFPAITCQDVTFDTVRVFLTFRKQRAHGILTSVQPVSIEVFPWKEGETYMNEEKRVPPLLKQEILELVVQQLNVLVS